KVMGEVNQTDDFKRLFFAKFLQNLTACCLWKSLPVTPVFNVSTIAIWTEKSARSLGTIQVTT
ncbi:hypothetical protein, partial [Mannheimia haemolytica]|uniref:hypothetical protein n=1 Tax=Mannheimia haemolytica TaxID=75985 RepID=UPI001EE291B1